MHDGYWKSDDFNDNIAIDIAASLMIIPGLEARLGYAQTRYLIAGLDVVILMVGCLQSWRLTLAIEFDTYDIQTMQILGYYVYGQLSSFLIGLELTLGILMKM